MHVISNKSAIFKVCFQHRYFRMTRLIECVPNFSEGRNKAVIDAIVAAIGGVAGVKVLNTDPGEAANRTVITFIGSPEAVVEAAFQGVRTAGELIDMRQHHGTHPRSGATDVLPLIPVSGVTLEECAKLARALAQRIYEELGIPCYCYEAAAYKPQRRNLAVCRAGEYESLPQKLSDPERRPDFGPDTFTDRVARSGAINVGARNFLIAVNFNLDTDSAELAHEVAMDVREKGHPGANTPGPLKGCKAIGWYIDEYGIAQVSMNITDINATPLHAAFEEVCRAAALRGLHVTGTEIVGMVPEHTLTDAGRYFLEKQQLSSDIQNGDLIQVAVRSMGLDDLRPFVVRQKVLEHALRPKVSVLMSFYKEPLEWIRLAVESIMNQTFTDFEFIIICDNPEYTEGIDYIERIAKEDGRIKLMVNPENIGLTRSLNAGIGLCSGQYIARMDADDISLGHRLERQVAFLDSHPEISVCASDVHVIDNDGKIVRKNKYKSKFDSDWNFICNAQAHPSVMFRSELKSCRSKLYNEEYVYAQDYELWQFLILKGMLIDTCREVLLLYRRSPSQITSVHKKAQNDCFKKAHRELINGWLVQRGIISSQECGQLKVMLKKASDAFGRYEGRERHQLALIIYVLYFCIGTYQWRYRFRFLSDRNLIAFRIRFVLTFRLFISSRSRKNRCGFL